jgi:CubicO group peptidase (beta-lactamase class C family)
MQRTILYVSIVMIFLLSACLPIAPAPEAAESAALYTEPAGRFTVPIPTNWVAENADGYGVLTSPDGQITVYVLALEGDDPPAAIAAAWELVEPGFDLAVAQVQTPPATGGVEQQVMIAYDTGDESEIVLAFGQRHAGIVYVTLLDAPLEALQQRGAQFNIIQTGFTITALERVDLAGVPPLPFDDDVRAEFEAYIVEAMARFNVPGAAVAVVQDGEIVYAQGFGVRDLEHGQPVTPDTKMMIGSTTKTFTTLLMAALVDEGLMDWDTPVVEILPGFSLANPEITERVTVRDLVCNCTGVSRRDMELLFNASDLSAEEIIESLATFEVFTDFGEAFQYSNQMIATGGYVAAAAAGGEYGDLYNAFAAVLQERILDPIGLTSTTLSFQDVQASDDAATPHGLDLSFEYAPIPLSQEAFVRPVAPAGALWSSALDMGRFLITQLSGGVSPEGVQVVPAENVWETWAPQVAVAADSSYGLGWFVAEYKGQPMLHHGGATIGFTSDLAFLPEANLGISVLSNARASSLNTAVRYRLLELLFQQAIEYDQQATFEFNSFKAEYDRITATLTAVDPEVVAPYLGRYASAALGEVVLELQNGALIMDAGEFRTELRPQVDEAGAITAYIAYDAPAMTGIPAQLTTDEAGNPAVVFGVGTFIYTFERLDP